MKKFILLAFMIMFIISCNKSDNADGGKEGELKEDSENQDLVELINFHGRQINLTPYFKGFPYSGFNPSFKSDKLFYYKEDSIKSLRMVSLSSGNLDEGEQISDIDFAYRNVFGMKYNDKDNSLYLYGDEINDEKIDLFRLDIGSGEMEKLTDVPYVFGWNWNESKDKIAFAVRLARGEKRQGELRILDLKSMEEKSIYKDKAEMRLTWGQPSWRPNGKGVVTSAYKNADRVYGNLIYIDFETGDMVQITAADKSRSIPSVLKEWISDDEFIYSSNESGNTNLYIYNFADGKSRQITEYSQNVQSFEMVDIEEEKFLVITMGNPIETKLVLLDTKEYKELHKLDIPELSGIIDVEGNTLLVSSGSATNKFKIDEVRVFKDRFEFKNKMGLTEELENKIVQADVEKIEFPTFDIDEKTGKQRMLHAYLYKPKNPLPEDKQIVMIQSFYGGANRYNVREHILAEAGVYVLSPAPRGSSGFGKDFYAMNDKDLGGNEIIDVFYAAKYISEKLNIPPSRVGVFGGSHGGYATMRCLTFPGEINGNKAEFDWGFGIAHAGFSDIIHFYESCNIPDWVTLEAGDPVKDKEKILDRSPLYHADKMKGKLLLTHGRNDSRVPIEGSLWMNDSLKKYEKNVRLEIWEGMGHHIKGLDNNIRQYKIWFDFLSGIE